MRTYRVKITGEFTFVSESTALSIVSYILRFHADPYRWFSVNMVCE